MAAAGSDLAIATVPQPAPTGPYIGLKPYTENERALFFGRDGDAKRLINKIFSARLTLFYGPSGVGKSSLLLARVVPDLRDPDIGDSIVVVFDRWGEREPEKAIKRQIADALGEDPATAEPKSLADLAEAVNRVTHKTLILILDQFEQFLLVHSARPDSFQAELARLLRGSSDAHVVVSLREEFLAGLEVLAREIVTIYDSKFRLEHLSDEGARDAIVKPAERFGIAVEPALVDALQVDLKHQADPKQQADRKQPADFGVASATMAAGIELPLLQLVCKGLWESSKRNGKNLSLDLYVGLGKRDGIMESYVRGLVNTLPPRQQDDAADALWWLARSTFIKQAYTADQLALLTKLPVERVERVLKHLWQNYVLRDRPIGGVRSFELYHDAYIKILAPLIDERVAAKTRRAAFRRRLRWGLSAATVIAALGISSIWYIDALRETRRIEVGDIDQAIATMGPLHHEHDNRAEQAHQLAILDYVFVRSAELVWREIKDKKDEKDHQDVEASLKKLEERFTGKNTPDKNRPVVEASPTKFVLTGKAPIEEPPTREKYIRPVTCMEPWARELFDRLGGSGGDADSAVLTLSVPAGVSVDDDALRCAWLEMTSPERERQFPLPWQISIDHGNGAAASLRVKFGDEAWDVPIDLPDAILSGVHNGGIVLDSDLRDHPQLVWYFGHKKYGRTQVVAGNDRVADAWMVPPWTLPLLRAANIRIRPKETALVVAVWKSIPGHEKALVTLPIVEMLIERTRKESPDTVREARRARRDDGGIRRVLVAMMSADPNFKLDNAFGQFHVVLDLIGQYPAPTDPARMAVMTTRTERPSGHAPGTYNDAEAAVAILKALKSLMVVPPSALPIGVAAAPPERDRVERVENEVDQQIARLAKRAQSDQQAEAEQARIMRQRMQYQFSPDVLAPDVSPVRVVLGDDWVSCVVENSVSEFYAGIERSRRNIWKRHGVMTPDIFFSEDPRGPPNQFTFEVAGARIAAISDPLPFHREGCLKDAIRAIQARLDRTRAAWVSAEDVSKALNALGGSRESWLRHTYSLTDLKLLLRAVLARPTIRHRGMAERKPGADGQEIRDLPELLASLIFWTGICAEQGAGKVDRGCLVERLRDTERALFGAAPAPPPDDALVKRIDGIAQALVGGTTNPADEAAKQLGLATAVQQALAVAVGSLVGTTNVADQAAEQFVQAIAVRQAFLAAFAPRILKEYVRKLDQRCAFAAGSVLTKPFLSGGEELQLEDLLDQASAAKSRAELARARMCLLRNYGKDESNVEAKMNELKALLAMASSFGRDPEDAAAVAVLALDAVQRGRGLSDAEIEVAQSLIKTAFAAWSEPASLQTAEKAFGEAVGICERPPTSGTPMCWSILRPALDAYQGPSTYLPLEFGVQTAYQGRPSDVTFALDLMERVRIRMSEQTLDEQKRLGAWMTVTTAIAGLVRAENGDRDELGPVPRALRALAANKELDQPAWPGRATVGLLQVRAARLAGASDEVQSILDDIKEHNQVSIEAERVWLHLVRGELAEARRMWAETTVAKTDRPYLSAVLAFVANDANELKQNAEPMISANMTYADYARLMVYVSSARLDEGAARTYLAARWKNIDRNSWDSRTALDDNAVWQEMLIGYYLHEVKRADLLAWIDDPRMAEARSESAIEYRGELAFYDAQLQSVTGDPGTRRERMIASLREAVAGGPALSNEYAIAVYQLHELEKGPGPRGGGRR
jgi:hypothetical protein